jgi:hypothetical protein
VTYESALGTKEIKSVAASIVPLVVKSKVNPKTKTTDSIRVIVLADIAIDFLYNLYLFCKPIL